MIEQAHDFMLLFLEAEHAAYQAMLLDPDFEQYRLTMQKVDEFSSGVFLTSRFARYASDPLLPKEEAEMQLESEFATRLLLRIEQYSYLDNRDLYAAYVTATDVWPGDTGPMARAEMRLLLEHTASGWQIISRQHAPNFAFPTWETTGGEDITLPDTPDEVVVYIPEENSA